MQIRPTKPHPGPFRMTNAAPEFAGIVLAIGFVVMGLVGLPIAKFFLLGAIALGGAVALLFHFMRN
jgi:hypothetical protein